MMEGWFQGVVSTVKRTRCGAMVKKTHEERDMMAGVLVLGIDQTSLSQDVEYTLREIKENQEDSLLALEPKSPWEFGHRMNMNVLSGWNCFVARLQTKFRGACLFLVFVHDLVSMQVCFCVAVAGSHITCTSTLKYFSLTYTFLSSC